MNRDGPTEVGYRRTAELGSVTTSSLTPSRPSLKYYISLFKNLLTLLLPLCLTLVYQDPVVCCPSKLNRYLTSSAPGFPTV